MISQSHRLNKNQVLVAKTTGQTIKSHHFTLVYCKSHDQKAHFAVVVSKKISPKAVVRNQLRRRWYMIARNYVSHTLSILIIPHQNILTTKSTETAADLNQALGKLCSKN